MSLTTAQAQALATAINADGTIAAARTAKDWITIANNYNAPSASLIWMPAVPVGVLVAAIVPADFASLTPALQNMFLAMCEGGFVDSTNANIQSWFSTIFAGKATTLTNLTAASKRLATKFEALFIISNVSSAFGISLSPLDVQQAMGS